MKRKELEDLKAKTAAELGKLLDDAKIEFEKLKLDMKQGKEKNVSLKKEKRKNITRMITFMHMNQIKAKKEEEK